MNFQTVKRVLLEHVNHSLFEKRINKKAAFNVFLQPENPRSETPFISAINFISAAWQPDIFEISFTLACLGLHRREKKGAK
jgi:hypothetical protein